ncbi:unnamed protein product [Ectocarpus sp. 6 AP-2014]
MSSAVGDEDESEPMVKQRAEEPTAGSSMERAEEGEHTVYRSYSSRSITEAYCVRRRRRVLKALGATLAAAVAAVWVPSLWTRESAAELTTVQLGWEGGRGEWTRGQRKLHERRDARFLPPEWGSADCMKRWGVPWLLTKPDPAGYIIFVNGREQLGSNRFLLSDGLYIAKTLNRTLVEFPVANARISRADSDLGFGAYWDLDSLCQYHRILGLGAFRSLIEAGRLDVENFLVMTPVRPSANPMSTLRTAKDVREAFGGYEDSQVIVMNGQWKSNIRRDPLKLIRPLPFYENLARRLIDQQQGWENEAFLAVQWRTETSTGNLTACYGHVREAVERYREQEGFDRGQVFFNTDLTPHSSGTYSSQQLAVKQQVLAMIDEDYPSAMNNTVTAYLDNLEDTGVKSLTSGVVAALPRVLLASTERKWWWSRRGVCQKIHSHFVDLVVEFREAFDVGTEGETAAAVGLFPARFSMDDWCSEQLRPHTWGYFSEGAWLPSKSWKR